MPSTTLLVHTSSARPLLPKKSASRSVELTVLVLFLVLLGVLFFNTAAPEKVLQMATLRGPAEPLSEKQPSEKPSAKRKKTPLQNVTEPAPPIRDDFGLLQEAFRVEQRRVEQHQTFADLLTDEGVSYKRAVQLANKARPTFDVRSLQAGRSYRVYRRAGRLEHLVYQESAVAFVDFDLGDSLAVRTGERPVSTVEQTATGTIEHSLYQTLASAGADPSLASALSKVYAWQIDFYHLRPGDRFKVIYEEKRVGGAVIGTGRILGARFDHRGDSYYGLYFAQEDEYFDTEGKSLRKALMQAPLDFVRISSRFQKRRYHPVLKEYRAHEGTDYAAAPGTPVYSVGDGRVTRARYGKYNGNNVKIRHNDTYETQYLHFSKIADGIEPGVRVKQKQVIGYVGSTGLATGPHVHYILRKNGEEVDPYKQDLPSAKPIQPEQRAAYASLKRRLLPRLRPEQQSAHRYAVAEPAMAGTPGSQP